MAYTVLARRYRSTSFEEVVGQEPIAKTLRNAIATGRVAHAYLFTGTRGVGKTSMARIFARALNAPDTVNDAPKSPEEVIYPDAEVQGRMAEAIMRGDDLNVIEIDGASNNKVEDARDLIVNAGLAPTANALFKIYIIDEVHMLSISAFNALLKTMEEPPAHVKFILCTTEAHKVPATIQSRCQRFDFRNIATQRIAEHLKAVLAKEEVEATDAVIWQLARLGNGSMRDGLSLLDRLIATGDRPLTEQTIEQMLGLPPQDMVVRLIDAMACGDVGAALERTGELLAQGIAQDQLLEVLIERLRQLMLIRSVGVASELVELSSEAAELAEKQAQHFDVPGLVHMIALCESLGRYSKSSSTPRALLDAGIVRLALAEKMADVTTLLSGRTTSATVADSKKKTDPRFPRLLAPKFPSPPPTSPPHPPPTTSTSTSPTSTFPPPSPPHPLHTSPVLAEPQTAREANVRSDVHVDAHVNVDVDREHSTADANLARACTTQNMSPLSMTGQVPEIWQRVLDLICDRPYMSWVKQLRLTQIDQDTRTARLQQPGRRNVARFISDRQREQLAELFEQVIGRRMRVDIATTENGEIDDSELSDTHEMTNRSSGSTDVSTASMSLTSSLAQSELSSGSRPSNNAIDRRAILTMPLVKMVADRFSVTLVDVHPEPDDVETIAVATASDLPSGDDQSAQPPLIARVFEPIDPDVDLMNAELDDDD